MLLGEVVVLMGLFYVARDMLLFWGRFSAFEESVFGRFLCFRHSAITPTSASRYPAFNS